ncbi:nucleotidyltransferase [Natranaerobius trueperi]|nr:nucleotidyltransferase [Natranaerobius trueperi]
MNGLGIVAEYNPFHIGHMYHINQSINKLNPDFTVAILSGNWVQRGEPAIIDKWKRTRAALNHGIDLVIELPYIWATQSAAEFAFGSVSLLNALNCVSYQTFGSESNDISSLYKAAYKATYETEEFKSTLQYHLDKGKTYSEAYTIALDLETSNPNDILGLEYLKNHIKLNTNIESSTIQRIGSSYTNTDFSGKFSSASAIRKIIKEDNSIETLSETVPDKSYQLLLDAYKNNDTVFLEHLGDFILYKLRVTDSKKLCKIVEWEPGMENLFKSAALESNYFENFITKCKTKRYTRARINRFLIHSLVDLNKESVKNFNYFGPPYIRILGMNSNGRKALKTISKQSSSPIITRPRNDLRKLDEYARTCFEWEVKTTALYNLIRDKTGKEEFSTPPIVLK